MSTPADLQLAGVAFGLVVEPGRPGFPAGADLERMLLLAHRNGILLRCAARMRELAWSLPSQAAALVRREEQRCAAVRRAMVEVDQACSRWRLDAMFPAAGQHDPDVGRDLDLLAVDPAERVDACLRGEVGARAMPRGLPARLAGTTVYRVPPCGVLLDVHLGRLGLCGDQEHLPRLMFRRHGSVAVGPRLLRVPLPEDHMVLYGLERLHGRARLRLSHLAWIMLTVRDANLDWDGIVHTARECGALVGLSCLLDYADQAHRLLLGRPADFPPACRRLITSNAGRISWRDDGFSFPLVTNARLHAARLASEAAAGQWLAVIRLGLAPIVFAPNAGRRLRARCASRRSGGGPTL